MNKNKILCIISGIFVFIFILTCIPGVGKSKSEKYSQICLVNPKSKELISSIEFQNNQTGIKLFRENNIWKGTELIEKEDSVIFPVDNKQIESFIEKLINNRKMYKSVDEKSLNSVNQTQNSEDFYIFIEISGNKPVKLKVSSTDFSQKNRYIKNLSDNKNSKIEWSDLDPFMHTEPRFWYDPYIIPRNIFEDDQNLQIDRVIQNINNKKKVLTDSEADFSYLKELRHGSLYAKSTSNLRTAGSYRVEYSDGNYITLNFYRYSDEDIVIEYFLPGKWNYKVFISQWTFERLLQI